MKQSVASENWEFSEDKDLASTNLNTYLQFQDL
jgi:hypothetical protein